MIELLDKTTLSIINKKLGYPLAVAEKDYFLVLVCKIIYESKLKDKLIFKGGTALYHTYLPQLRFSEDLDFSTNQVGISLADVKSIFTPFEFLSIKKDYVSPATIKIERLLYAGPLGQSNSLKIEVDFLQNVILPSKEIDYKNEYGVNAKVKVMDIREITAEKIRAMSDRIKYRDFYDFSMIMQEIKPNLLEVLDLVKQKEVRRSISFENILSNWKLAKDDKINELQSIYYSKELSDAEIEVFLKALRSKFSKPIYKS